MVTLSRPISATRWRRNVEAAKAIRKYQV